jgi:hypothetical protein
VARTRALKSQENEDSIGPLIPVDALTVVYAVLIELDERHCYIPAAADVRFRTRFFMTSSRLLSAKV